MYMVTYKMHRFPGVDIFIGCKLCTYICMKDFLFKSNYFLFHYLITIDDHFGLLVLIIIVQIPYKFFQNMTKPLQCYTTWYARYVKSQNRYLEFLQ